MNLEQTFFVPFGEGAMHVVQKCANCLTESRCRRRDFSAQVWSVLLMWEEVGMEAVDQPICNDCYGDLREILIERCDEMEEAIRNGTVPPIPSSEEIAEKSVKEKKASGQKAAAKPAAAKKSRKVKIA